MNKRYSGKDIFDLALTMKWSEIEDKTGISRQALREIFWKYCIYKFGEKKTVSEIRGKSTGKMLNELLKSHSWNYIIDNIMSKAESPKSMRDRVRVYRHNQKLKLLKSKEKRKNNRSRYLCDVAQKFCAGGFAL